MTRQHLSKPALRRIFLERRAQIPPDIRKISADKACELFFEHIKVPAGAIVAGYWPIRAELDDLPILLELTRLKRRCALPHVAGEEVPLVFRAWHETTPLVPGMYGIQEPAVGASLKPDIILVPMAAFDVKGHRLGYGAGFYDRTLKAIRPLLAIGLAYEEQLCGSLPVEENDVRMDMIITDRNVYRFGDTTL
ncbi:MAG: 5-formyltetrahydrofolate cyclo-ligase [Proteobacteria bacterium]|nr:5-formyltetrahydrofolate cyclo-ligase [Pseudomonadota bacterium]